MEYFRNDGVRITHDPYDPKMAEKYGIPGETDKEGFDPYNDTVGPGIYGGIVKRDESGLPLVGQQYQNHNTRPGPVYAGGGYTPMNQALGDNTKVAVLLDKYPDLVNDISTGGAQPLHNCGMSQRNQHSVNLLVDRGADIEAVDTYGYTPLLRMASNNLALGAKTLLEAGADPNNKGNTAQTPSQCAQRSGAMDVVRVLQEWGMKRKETTIKKIIVVGTGNEDVNEEYVATDAKEIPCGFDSVCKQQGWDTQETWEKLNSGASWFKAKNGAYIYWNKADGCWWIDEPSGNGIFKAKAPSWAPPQTGWIALGPFTPVPSLVATFCQFVK